MTGAANEAQRFFLENGVPASDSPRPNLDNDGIACESGSRLITRLWTIIWDKKIGYFGASAEAYLGCCSI